MAALPSPDQHQLQPVTVSDPVDNRKQKKALDQDV